MNDGPLEDSFMLVGKTKDGIAIEIHVDVAESKQRQQTPEKPPLLHFKG